jgi:hypothetical protein
MLYALGFISLVDLLCAIVVVILAQAHPHRTEGVHVPAEYLISIEWDKMVDADVDLWAAPPPGRERPVLYNNREEGALALDRDSRGFIDDMQAGPDGKPIFLPHREVITMRGIVPGYYAFGVHMYDYREHGLSERARKDLHLPVHYRVEKVNPHVATIAEGDVTLEFVGDATNIAAFDVNADGSYKLEDPPLTPIADIFYKHAGAGAPALAPPSNRSYNPVP